MALTVRSARLRWLTQRQTPARAETSSVLITWPICAKSVEGSKISANLEQAAKTLASTASEHRIGRGQAGWECITTDSFHEAVCRLTPKTTASRVWAVAREHPSRCALVE